ncbi:MAG: ATP-grasp domain-containing protein [Alphaproteobacteria bacterium]|nr:ATP-grasp domain-containing protein [Alphaproteobacteria bacterium]
MGTVAFIESNTTGTGHILAAKALARGHAVRFLSVKPERYPYLRKELVHPTVVDTQDPAAILAALRGMDGLVAVLSSSSYFLEAAAGAAQALGLPGSDPDAIATCVDKWRTREALAAAGVAVPRTTRVTSMDEARAAWDAHGGPIVIKPIAGSGSLGVRLHRARDGFLAHAQELLATTENERGIPIDPTVLVQDFIDGPELSVEMISDGSTHHLIGVTRKHLGPPPHFVEVGHDFPAPLDPAVTERVAAAVRAALNATGMTFGPTHTELRLRGGEPVIIEINPRLAGGMIPVMIERASGLDVLEQVLSLHLGEPIDLTPPRQGAASIGFVVPPEPGVLTAAALPGAMPGVTDAVLNKGPGDAVVREGGFRDRIGHLIAVGATVDESRARVDAAVAAVRLAVDPAARAPAAASGDTGRLKVTLHPEALAIVRTPPPPAQRRVDLERLVAIDQAHLLMLAEQGILSRAAVRAVLAELRRMEAAGFDGLVDSVAPRGTYLLYEDALIARLGVKLGGVTHTGRSRNDINACTFRLALRGRFTASARALWRLRSALVRKAAQTLDVAMPVYSQFQPGLPGTLGYYLLGVEQALQRDQRALQDLRPALDTSPMGACAGGGTTVPIDPARVAALLGFAEVCASALDAVASRDLTLRLLAALSISGVHVSRLAQDIQLWTTREFSLLELPDALAGGSSMMPQKKNPYLLEMIKGRATRPMGHWTSATATMQGTPFSNSVEVGTEAQVGVTDAFKAYDEAAALMALIVEGAAPRPQAMVRSVEQGVVVASGVADDLVRATGAPFRQVHHQVGAAITGALDRGSDPNDAVLALLSEDEAPKDALAWAWRYEHGGGPGRASTQGQLRAAERALDVDAAWLRQTEAAWAAADAARAAAVDALLAEDP